MQLSRVSGVKYYRLRKELYMFVIVTVLFTFLLLALAGADILVSNISSDELSNMGVEKKI
jgi:hypothetical protein